MKLTLIYRWVGRHTIAHKLSTLTHFVKTACSHESAVKHKNNMRGWRLLFATHIHWRNIWCEPFVHTWAVAHSVFMGTNKAVNCFTFDPSVPCYQVLQNNSKRHVGIYLWFSQLVLIRILYDECPHCIYCSVCAIKMLTMWVNGFKYTGENKDSQS